MIGHSVGVQDMSDPAGVTPLEAWYALDTHGKVLPCNDTATLNKVIRSKASINLQVKLWAEDLADCALLSREEVITYTNNYPKWVRKAVFQQAGKILMKTVGFIPSFAKE